MARGRRPQGAKLVDKFEGSPAAKQRLRLILETLAGKRTVKDAGVRLGITARRFHRLRTEFLRRALGYLTVRSAGRPSKVKSAADERIAELEAEVQTLRLSLQAAVVREEIALTMPGLMQRALAKKKTRRRHRGVRESI